MSRLHASDVENTRKMNVNGGMPRRDEIIARLEELPDILGKKHTDIAEALGISASQWANYRSENASQNVIVWDVALELSVTFGIPMEWTYAGLLDRVTDAVMRAKLAGANRRIAAKVTPRSGRRGRGTNIAIVVAASAVLFGACSTAGHAWKRMDGLPIDAEKVSAARLICRGEADKANMAAGQNAAIAPDAFGWSQGMMNVYNGCMAAQGYLSAGP